jgi:hypothetical protein
MRNNRLSNDEIKVYLENLSHYMRILWLVLHPEEVLHRHRQLPQQN